MKYTLTANGNTNVPIPSGHSFTVLASGTPDSSTLAVQYSTAEESKAVLTTALAGADNDLIFTAREGGTVGNEITVAYIADADSPNLKVAVDGKDILVHLELDTDGTTILSTAAEVTTAIQGNSRANGLVSVANAAANDGSGVVIALAETSLASGDNGTFASYPEDGTFTAAGGKNYDQGGESDWVNLNVSSAGGSTSWLVIVTDFGNS